MCRDALDRDESCGCHFRRTVDAEGECDRNDDRTPMSPPGNMRGRHRPICNQEPLVYEAVKMVKRNYK